MKNTGTKSLDGFREAVLDWMEKRIQGFKGFKGFRDFNGEDRYEEIAGRGT